VRTYFKLNRVEQAEEQQLLQSRAYGEVGEMLQTELGRLQEKAWRDGERAARQQMQTELGRLTEEARHEGAKVALRDALLGVIRSRFPTVPESIEAQIRGVEDLTTLDDLIRRAAGATTLEEIQGLLGQ
jgi:hypothetical protein